MSNSDTIAAISSPPGKSTRGIIRLSGPDAHRIARKCFVPAHGTRTWPRRGHLAGHVHIDDLLQAPASVCIFTAPHSFTREDIVELHLPGSAGLLALVMETVCREGARPAHAGEFSERAFRNGAIDITAAASIAAMILATSDRQLRAARKLLDGQLAVDAAAAREALLDVRALVEASLDFSDEDIAFITPAQLIDKLQHVTAGLRATVAAGSRAERLTDPPLIVLAGPPNAGKSTLMNRLTGLDRALCSPTAGTTRDMLCAPLRLAQTEVMLCDTAGIETSPLHSPCSSSRSGTEIDQLAYQSTVTAMQRAKLVVWVTDLRRQCDPGPELPSSRIVALNKCDAISPAEAAAAANAARALHGGPVVTISALTGAGCAELLGAMDHLCEGIDSEGDMVLLSTAIRADLILALQCVDRAIEVSAASPESLQHAELVAVELASAADALARLAGAMPVDEVYGRIFSTFCVGK